MDDNKQMSKAPADAVKQDDQIEETVVSETPADLAKEEEQAEAEKQSLPSNEGRSATSKASEPVEKNLTASEQREDSDTPATDTQITETPIADAPDGSRWYVVHTYSGHENKVATALKQRIESERLEDKIVDVLVPTQDKIEIKGGKKVNVKEKIFPGYILVKMFLDDNSWLAVRTIQGVTSFVGVGNKPTPISEAEVQTIIRFTKEEQPTFKQVFSPDDTVKIVDGPFAEFIGKVDSVDEEKGKVRVLVSIFGRETPVELDFLQVQKI